MIYDPKRRQYIERGRARTPKEVRDHVETLIQSEQSEVDKESKKVLLGILPLAVFFDWMREKIRTWHSIAGVIAYGGQSEMNLERWKRINEIVQSQIAYLNDFEKAAEQSLRETQRIAAEIAASKDIPAGLDAVVARDVEAAIMSSDAAGRDAAVRDAVENALADSIGPDEAGAIASHAIGDTLEAAAGVLIWGAVASRSGMYAQDAVGTYENADREGIIDRIGEVLGLPTVDIGEVVERRIINSSAPCDDCQGYADEGWQPLGTLPDAGEDCQCTSRCMCEFEWGTQGSMREGDTKPEGSQGQYKVNPQIAELPVVGAYVVDPSAMPRGGRARL